MKTGFIKIVKSAGYGFIETKEGIDFYFHFSNYVGNWKMLLAEFVNSPKERKIEVEFEVDSTAKAAPKAKEVKIIIPNGTQEATNVKAI